MKKQASKRDAAKRQRTYRPKPNGYVLHETADLVVIATGFRRKSANPKTGDMVQVWILNRNVNPVRAIKLGKDNVNCLDCKLRGVKGKKRACYVRVANAPLGVFKAYKRGNYPKLETADYAAKFGGRSIRFGAYGEPVLIPIEIVRAMVAASAGRTGYTHQWANPAYQEYGQFIMASCDNTAEYAMAKELGWRTFRVRSEAAPLLPREIICPASDEGGRRTTCEDCKLCSGTLTLDPRKDIAIIVHGIGARSFDLIQIGA